MSEVTRIVVKLERKSFGMACHARPKLAHDCGPDGAPNFRFNVHIALMRLANHYSSFTGSRYTIWIDGGDHSDRAVIRAKPRIQPDLAPTETEWIESLVAREHRIEFTSDDYGSVAKKKIMAGHCHIGWINCWQCNLE